MRHAADVPAGAAGNKGKCTAFVLEADMPALLRKGAVEALGGQLDFSRDALALRKKGVAIPLRVSRKGRYTLSVVDFAKDASRKAASASFS